MSKTYKVNVEPQWANMVGYLKRSKDTESLQAILNLYQGFRDFVTRQDTEYAKAFYKAMTDSGFNVQDLEKVEK